MTSTKKIPTILCASPWPPIEIPTTFLSEKNCELLTQKSSDAGSIVRKPPNESVYLVVQFYQVRVPGTAMFWCWLSVWRECRPPDTDPQFARWSADHRLRSTDVRDDLHLSLSLSLSLSLYISLSTSLSLSLSHSISLSLSLSISLSCLLLSLYSNQINATTTYFGISYGLRFLVLLAWLNM